MTDKAIKFECKKDCKKKNTSECYELNCIEGQTDVLEQLSRKTAECEKLKIEKLNYKQSFELVCKERTRFRDKWLEVTYVLEDLKNENKHLKKCFLTCSNNLKKQKKQYQFGKQALDVIEKELKEDIYCESQECGCDDYEECLKCTKEHILDIIRKAKENNNGL